MNDRHSDGSPDDEKFAREIGARASRMLKAKKRPGGVWFGLGMMGLVGWTVAVPTLLGAAAGVWLDARHPGAHPWTLAFLVGGLVLGCLNAWYWIAKEDRAMRDDQEEDRG